MTVTNQNAFGDELDCEVYLHPHFKEYLDLIPHLIETDYDAWGVIFGEEGSGKTVDGLTVGYYLDSDLSVENVVFTQEGFLEAVDNLPRGSVLLWDEADAAAGHHASNQMSVLQKKAKRIRTRNLIIILIQPTLLDYNKYFINRFRWGLQPYDFPWKEHPSDQRGYANLYNRARLRELYYKAKRNYGDLSVGNPNHDKIRFANVPGREGFPVPIGKGSEYDKKKQAVTERLTEDEDTPTKIQSFGGEEIHTLLEYAKREGELKEVAEVLEWDYNTLLTRKRRLVES
jgi:hypothetical protein